MQVRERRAWRLAKKLLLALCVGLAAAELGLRVLRTRSPSLRSLLYLPHETGDFGSARSTAELLSHSVTGYFPRRPWCDFITNSRGFRTIEYSEQRPEGVYRIVALGDSFTFCSGGVPYQEHWTNLVQGELRSRWRGGVEILNLGVNGVGPVFEHRLWQLEGSRLEADLVILAFFVGNDFVDNAGALGDRDRWDALARWSFCARLVRNLYRVRNIIPLPEVQHPMPEVPEDVPGGVLLGDVSPELADFYRYDPESPTHTLEEFLEIEGERLRICDRKETERFEGLASATEETLLALRDQIVETGADLVVLVIPDVFQVEEEILSAVLVNEGRLAEDFELDRPQRWLAELFVREGIAFVDVLADLRRARTSGPLYGFQDTHWSAVGNAEAAPVLSDFLVQRLSNLTGDEHR